MRAEPRWRQHSGLGWSSGIPGRPAGGPKADQPGGHIQAGSPGRGRALRRPTPRTLCLGAPRRVWRGGSTVTEAVPRGRTRSQGRPGQGPCPQQATVPADGHRPASSQIPWDGLGGRGLWGSHGAPRPRCTAVTSPSPRWYNTHRVETARTQGVIVNTNTLCKAGIFFRNTEQLFQVAPKCFSSKASPPAASGKGTPHRHFPTWALNESC